MLQTTIPGASIGVEGRTSRIPKNTQARDRSEYREISASPQLRYRRNANLAHCARMGEGPTLKVQEIISRIWSIDSEPANSGLTAYLPMLPREPMVR
ncbi:hypothetical protein FA13DRAFT_1729792 [Coprinellus micaceus]|uniref:Uncharacterized protein n=1 Tax=Coprinellus micaceus TaxID=71717 RepID=A0A4Y7TJC9_COPMI|nr:hypothetical protein FA13DRAFT_1729792 [Coprinellus micaceus]